MDEYVKGASDAQRSAAIVRQSLDRADGFGDISAINAFQRMIDPGVAVREGDVALIQSAIAKFDQLNPAFLLKKLQSGDKLDATTRKRMSELAETIYDVRAKAANETTIPRYKELSKRAGVDFGMVGQEFPTKKSAKDELPAVKSQAEYEALKPGQKFIWNGRPGVKP